MDASPLVQCVRSSTKTLDSRLVWVSKSWVSQSLTVYFWFSYGSSQSSLSLSVESLSLLSKRMIFLVDYCTSTVDVGFWVLSPDLRHLFLKFFSVLFCWSASLRLRRKKAAAPAYCTGGPKQISTRIIGDCLEAGSTCIW